MEKGKIYTYHNKPNNAIINDPINKEYKYHIILSINPITTSD